MQQNEFKEDMVSVNVHFSVQDDYTICIKERDVMMFHIVSGFCGFCSAKQKKCWAWHFPFGEQWFGGSEAGHPNGPPRW